MDWNKFKNKFHVSWHKDIQLFIESNECNKIYAYLKKQKGEIAPKSTLTFRAFEQSLENIKCIVILDEPYNNKYKDLQYADGVPLSCEYVQHTHPQLLSFYKGLEKEFYDLKLDIITDLNMEFYQNQGILFLTSSLTTEINSPRKHKNLWVPFIRFLIKEIFSKKRLPIVFCGEEIYNQYKNDLEVIYPWFLIKQSLSECAIGVPWNTNGTFTKVNKYLLEKNQDEIQWVNVDVPF